MDKTLCALIGGLAISLLSMIIPAYAVQITDPAAIGQSRAVTFDDFDELVTSGPEQVGMLIDANVLFTADTASTLGAHVADLGDNGLWGGLSPFAAVGEPLIPAGVGTVTFTFGNGPVSAAGALLNYYRDALTNSQIMLAALDDTGGVLESYIIDISTPGALNGGAFYGIARSTADIRALAITGDALVLDDVTFAAVPEPSTAAMVLTGLGLLSLAWRRLRRV